MCIHYLLHLSMCIDSCMCLYTVVCMSKARCSSIYVWMVACVHVSSFWYCRKIYFISKYICYPWKADMLRAFQLYFSSGKGFKVYLYCLHMHTFAKAVAANDKSMYFLLKTWHFATMSVKSCHSQRHCTYSFSKMCVVYACMCKRMR